MANGSSGISNLMSFIGTYDAAGTFTAADWGSDNKIAKLVESMQTKGEITTADINQLIALTGDRDLKMNFTASMMKQLVDLLRGMLQKLG